MGQTFDQRHTVGWSHDENACGQAVTQHRTVRDNGDTSARRRRLTGRRIEQMVIAPAVLHEKALVVARGAERAVAQVHLRKALSSQAAWIVDADSPGTSITMSGQVHVATELNHEITESSGAEGRDGAIDRVAVPDTTQMDSNGAAPQEHRR